tara:strand:+ start:946 stop:1143 length:198 start_codon:yes stop_codon:yes gene_type:complete
MITEKEKIKLKLRKYVSYSLGIGGLAHFIEFGVAMYEDAHITSIITLIFGVLDLIAAYLVKGDIE